jgi:plasmid stabilization system protein ParE
MAEVRWTPQAVEDLEVITDFIATDSVHYASLFAMDVLTAVERLTTFPASGRIVPDMNDPAIREIILGNYRLYTGSKVVSWRFWPCITGHVLWTRRN